MRKIKFSIIIPVYNVGEYLPKCLDSVINQTYDNLEAIIVCDKCDDNSEKIVDNYIKKDNRFTKVYKENTGLSIARNIGVKKATGDYILFLDSDDYLDNELLKVLMDNLIDNPEMIRFQVRNIKANKIYEYHEKEFDLMEGINAFEQIVKYHYVENAWCYLYKKSFFKTNKFEFSPHRIAEDFGLLPLIIAKAKSIKSIDFIGYNYVERSDSLMNNSNYDMQIKKMDDMLFQANKLKDSFESISNNKRFMMFIDNSLIYFSTTLKYKEFKKYRKEMINMGFYTYMICTNFRQLLKKRIIKMNAYIYYRLMVK